MKQTTPRTDEYMSLMGFHAYCQVDDHIDADFAKELETELNETKAALEREQQDCAALRQMVHELRDALAECREDSVELLGEWAWKRGTIPRNDRAIEELEGRISIADSIIAAWPIELLNNK